MPAEEECNWLGTGSATQIHWDRFKWNLTHLHNFKDHNPFYKETSGGKERKAYKDFWHSAVNVSVEFARACPYRAGHILFWENMILGGATICLLAGWAVWEWVI